ncbi:FISUMP domain-containing protein [uncultured Fibrobacter sp.]|uniref:FISUMP domain-containing protein n=1 Tax=uncultured Fibrobacter sp. TaxID=261512 RepID=UPI0025DE7A2D|nr:FISUMP domain-containing protein [uncultured Fibrobacter sp.]
MKNTFAKMFTVCTLAGVLGAAFIGCGDDDSSSPKGTGLPAKVADMEELETYGCGMDVIGEKVYVVDLELNYECDGEKWFKSYDQTRPSSTSTKSSSSKKSDGSSDSKAADKDGSSSSDATTSSSSAKSSSSRPTEILEPEITVNETCTEVGACDAMVKTDISTWHFVRKDNFGDDAEYTYTVDGKDLIVTIKNADGTTNSKTYSMYNMESEAGVEMAFNAAKSTCKNGGGNDNVISKTCVKDTILALPECKSSIDGALGIDTAGIKVICLENEWKRYIEYGSLTDARDGQTYKTVKIGEQIWMAQNLNYAYLVPTDEEDSSSICYEDNCALFGRHYLWSAAMDSAGVFTDNAKGCGSRVFCSPIYPVRGICPEGWHLPDFQEFETMLFFVGAKVENYKNIGEIYVDVNHREFGFTIPYDGISVYRYLTSTETDYDEGFTFGVNFERAPDKVTMWGAPKNRFNPVRCIKDSD